MSMIFQSYALWPHMTVAENVAYGLKIRKLDKADDRRQAQGDPVDGAPRGAGRALSRRTVGRPAAARVARPRAGGRARDPAARRAAVQPRRQPARGDALRDPPPARPVPLHHGLRDPRPGRGHDHGRPDRRHEPRQGRAARAAGGDLRRGRARSSSPASSAAPTSCAARRSTTRGSSVAGAPLRTTGRPLAGRASRWRCRCASTRSSIANEKPQSADNHLPAVVTRQVFLGSARDYTVALDDKTELRVTAPPGAQHRAGPSGVAAPAGGTMPGIGGRNDMTRS